MASISSKPQASKKTSSSPAPRTSPGVALHLEHLAQVPAPSEAEQALFLVPALSFVPEEPPSSLRVQALLEDLDRWVSIVELFWNRASASARASVLGFSEGLLKTAALEGRKLLQMSQAQPPSETLHPRLAELLETGLQRRNQLRAILEGASYFDPSLVPLLDQAWGHAREPRALAESLRALSKLGRGLVGQSETTAARYLLTGHATEAFFDTIDTLAKSIESAARSANAAYSEPLLQQEIRCLGLMRWMMLLFNTAHELDPKVPRLVPLATRRIFEHL